jgi:hypothetical protein
MTTVAGLTRSSPGANVRDQCGLDALGIFPGGEVGLSPGERGERGQRPQVGPILDVLRLRDEPLWRLVAERDQPVGVRVGQGPEQDAVDDAEDRGVGADAERDREDDDRRERRAAHDTAQSVPCVRQDRVHLLRHGRGDVVADDARP